MRENYNNSISWNRNYMKGIPKHSFILSFPGSFFFFSSITIIAKEAKYTKRTKTNWIENLGGSPSSTMQLLFGLLINWALLIYFYRSPDLKIKLKWKAVACPREIKLKQKLSFVIVRRFKMSLLFQFFFWMPSLLRVFI